MARRNSFSLVPSSFGADERSSLGDSHVSDAITAINKVQQRAVATMTHYPHTREGTLSMLFHDTDIAKLKLVRGMVETDSEHKTYPLPGGRLGVKPEIVLTINFNGAMVPAIQPTAMRIYPDRIEPLLAFTAAVKAEHDKYEELKGVLRWLNRNATPGAIRYFFPQAMKLVPTSPIWKDLQEVPSRYTTPPDYGVWAQVIRDAANTVAGMMLLPADVEPRKRERLWLTFKTIPVHLDQSDPNKVHYSTDQVIYNL